MGVVLPQDPASAGQGVLVEGAGLLVLTQRAQVAGEVVGRGEGVGVVLAQDPAVRARVSSSRVRACWESPNLYRTGRGCWPS